MMHKTNQDKFNDTPVGAVSVIEDGYEHEQAAICGIDAH